MGKPLHIPSAIPYPQAVRRGWIPVPNAQAVEWPSAQFAPAYFAPGASSVQPYSYQSQQHVLYGDAADNRLNSARDAGWQPKKLFIAAALIGFGGLLYTVFK